MEFLIVSGSYNLGSINFITFFVSFNVVMEALDVMIDPRGSCNTQFDISEELFDTKGVAKITAGIIAARNDSVDDIQDNSKCLEIILISSTHYKRSDGSNQYTKTQQNLGAGSVNLAGAKFVS